MPLYLGIDGGGTKTTVAVADERSILAVVTGSGCSPTRYPPEKVRQALRDTIAQACSQAGVQPGQIDFSCLGSPGTSIDAGMQLLNHTVRELISGSIRVIGDMELAHRSAFFGYPGVVVISGTGSIAFGRNPKGDTARAGGWGPAVSDEGSGTWIGRQAVAATLRALDSGTPTRLTTALASAWTMEPGAEQLVAKSALATSQEFAQLFPAVQRSAAFGDEVAQRILTRAGIELAALAKTVVKRIWPVAEPCPVAMAGGIFCNSAVVRQAFYNYVHAQLAHTRIRLSTVPPVMGAISIAREIHAASEGKS